MIHYESQLTLALVFGVPGVTVPPGISTAAAITPPPLILVCDLNDVTDSWKNNLKKNILEMRKL